MDTVTADHNQSVSLPLLPVFSSRVETSALANFDYVVNLVTQLEGN